MFRYTVRCEFTKEDDALIGDWLDWLRNSHIHDVLAAGASAAELVKMDAEPSVFEIRYTFNSREHFQAYESDHASRLREEGLQRFPLARGLVYSRSTGEVMLKLPP